MQSNFRVKFHSSDLKYQEFSTIVADKNDTESETTVIPDLSTVQPELRATQLNVPKVSIVNRSPLDEFSDDLFTGNGKNHFFFEKSFFSHCLILDEERSDGAVIFHIFCAIYFFTLLAIVCNDYFLPSVECVCEDLNISKVNNLCSIASASK